MPTRHPLIDTCELILQQKLPNLLRLYINPYVAQTCFCLSSYVHSVWGKQADDVGDYQSFLANGFDEALSGAIKLGRYCASLASRPTTGLVVDPDNRLGPYASASVAGGNTVEFVPGLVVIGHDPDLAHPKAGSDLPPAINSAGPFGLLVLVAGNEAALDHHAAMIRLIIRRDAPVIITCANRTSLAELRSGTHQLLREIPPDIVIFDESFVDQAVPFSAFTARKTLYGHWNKPGKTTFHSTTFQPNTISSLHFMKGLATADPVFHESLADDLAKIATDHRVRGNMFRRLYSPSLYRLIRTVGFHRADVRASGDFIYVNGQPIFDAVSGVACSVRGHNPSTYAEELAALPSALECEAELSSRLRTLTGLPNVVPAVSGATAVENALKLALVAQYPRRHVLALRAGFGGKTLLALTGTANPSYKTHIDPLYADVTYVDPFAPDAKDQIDAVLQQHSVAVVQAELIQAVGGVRRVPEDLIRYLDARRQDAGYLLLIDEVQTGMYRTGPFTQSGALGLSPDLLLLGKGTSDMMFPFALTLYSATVEEKLARGSDLPAALRKKYGYEFGYKTVLNVLRRADELRLPQRVAESGDLFASVLRSELVGCKLVRNLRVYGLLIGLELDAPQRWLSKRLFYLYLYNMLRHHRFPVLVGFCQYEPNVLKITPSLTASPSDIRALCETIADVLKRPLPRLLAGLAGGLFQSISFRRKKHEYGSVPTPDAVAR